MTENYYTSSNYVDHTTFGGELSSFDFDGHHTLKSMTDRILSDWRFDNTCKVQAENRDRQAKWKKG